MGWLQTVEAEKPRLNLWALGWGGANGATGYLTDEVVGRQKGDLETSISGGPGRGSKVGSQIHHTFEEVIAQDLLA
jgi:hypothetical protein